MTAKDAMLLIGVFDLALDVQFVILAVMLMKMSQVISVSRQVLLISFPNVAYIISLQVKGSKVEGDSKSRRSSHLPNAVLVGRVEVRK